MEWKSLHRAHIEELGVAILNEWGLCISKRPTKGEEVEKLEANEKRPQVKRLGESHER
jgi:hypothetical protein